MGHRDDDYWVWRNKQIDDEDERKRLKRRNELISSSIMKSNAEAIMELIKDEFVTLPSDPPFAEESRNDMKGKKKEILLLIQQNVSHVPTHFLKELAFNIVDINLRWPDAGDRLDNLRKQLEKIIQKYNDDNLKIFLMDVQILLMDLVMMHRGYLEKMQEWNRSSL